MDELSPDRIRQALADVRHPTSGQSVVTLGMVSGIVVKGRNVGFALEVPAADAQKLEPLRRACEEAVKALPGVGSCTVVLTAERGPPPDMQARPAAPAPTRAGPPGIDKIIAVASGKGGVGKSTTAINLACGLRAAGLRVGLLDADIYGPSMPRMAGLSGRPTTADGKKMQPMEVAGVKLMSMGFLVEEETPMIWRGPMVQSALQQMLGDVAWGELDIMVVDMPPGTGDAQLTMAQKVPLAGAIIVSTPQDIALLDARKAINMFRRVDVPILGIVENMSYFCCPNCGHRTEIFAHGGARECAAKYNVDFLAEIPLDIVIRETSDSGRPIVVSQPDSPQAQAYMNLALTVRDKLAGPTGVKPFPRIVDA
ncbi:MAG: iron-sulfur cluster carrier protein ApbC [Geminicoccaceae bacterium]|nr:iron-sulfur cluster carrier protein ApbC [Geminicoccaceae bacterium]HRY25628.1 iron-sulfur cluster carrier protein ApbC [Geminicoccaceae bacterium]